MKRCSICKAMKELESFYRDRQKRDGRSPYCKSCHDEKNRQSAKAHPDSARAAKRRWRRRNQLKQKAAQMAWNAGHRQLLRERWRVWATLNRSWIESYRRANRQLFRRAAMEWAARNPEKVKTKTRERRARLMGATGHVSLRAWQDRIAEFDGRCAYCLQPLTQPTQDHIRPLNRGGSHDVDNLVPACMSCNSSKHDDLVFGWLPRGVGVCLPSMSGSS